MTATKLALVLGATGGIGGEVASALQARGWKVRALARKVPVAPPRTIEWLKGDAMCAQDVLNAAEGVDLIVHAVNPPGYRDWEKLVLPMLENSIAAARATGARILLPGTLYNYGAGTAQPLTEATAQQPSSRKGQIRLQMEQRLREASARGARVLIVRAGDFFGPRAANNWFSQGLVKPGQKLGAINYPGARAVGHAWAYLPDLAETMARLVEQEASLATFETVHFRGHWDGDGMQMAEAIGTAVGRPELPLRRMPWWVLRVLAPVVPLFREMVEVRYLWQEAFALDNAKLVRLLGTEPHTPLLQAVSTTLTGLGLIDAQDSATPASIGRATVPSLQA